MKNTMRILSLCISLTLLISSAALAQSTVEETADFGDEKKKLWEIHGYIQSENYLMVNPGIKKSRNEEVLNKIEQHGKLEFKIGTDEIHGRGVVHGFLYPTNEYAGGSNNRMLINELYIKYLTNLIELKVGRQIIQWGTADVINPTSYFAPMDFGELFLKDDDEFFLGVDGVSLMFLIKNWSIQLVTLPVGTFSQLPATSSPWAFQYPHSTYQRQIPDRSFNEDNVCYGGRVAASISGVDFSFSGYHGIDRELLLFPTVTGPTSFLLTPSYKTVSAFGFDIAYTIKDFTMQAEAAYSFDKSAIKKGNIAMLIAPKISKTHFLEYAAGINWQIDVDSNDFFVVVEFFNSHYLKDADDFEDPVLFGLFITRITKRLFNNSFLIECSAMVNVFNEDWILIPTLGYDFLNGFSVQASAYYMAGERDTLFGSNRDRDIVSISAKYEF